MRALDLFVFGCRYLSKGLAEAASVTGLDPGSQKEVLATCTALTTALGKLADTGLEHLVFTRPSVVPHVTLTN